MRKVIMILAAIVLVASGVAAVSAYEAHTVNVTATVENALSVTPEGIEFGTVFPEEWWKQHVTIALSTSALEVIVNPATAVTDDLIGVEYTVCAEWKLDPAEDTTADPNHVPDIVGDDGTGDYYAWLGKVLYVGINPPNNVPYDPTQVLTNYDLFRVGTAPATIPGAKIVKRYNGTAWENMTGYLDYTNTVTNPDELDVAIDAPVFEGSYNSLTDDLVMIEGAKPSGLDHPTWKIDEYLADGTTANPYHLPGGLDLGLDLKIQVSDIDRKS